MEKPITIIIQETKDKLVEVLNTSNLPPVILEPIVKDIYNEITMLTKRQYEKDLYEYNNQLSQANNNIEVNTSHIEEPTV